MELTLASYNLLNFVAHNKIFVGEDFTGRPKGMLCMIAYFSLSLQQFGIINYTNY